ncbi:MAG: hypothetical protein U9Q06_00265 [Nanoarchaeota archaeon]|nr:hypothetical protein [Nanoarchaeota archaeon]
MKNKKAALEFEKAVKFIIGVLVFALFLAGIYVLIKKLGIA